MHVSRKSNSSLSTNLTAFSVFLMSETLFHLLDSALNVQWTIKTVTSSRIKTNLVISGGLSLNSTEIIWSGMEWTLYNIRKSVKLLQTKGRVKKVLINLLTQTSLSFCKNLFPPLYLFPAPFIETPSSGTKTTRLRVRKTKRKQSDLDTISRRKKNPSSFRIEFETASLNLTSQL